jgi:hypothetical protein
MDMSLPASMRWVIIESYWISLSYSRQFDATNFYSCIHLLFGFASLFGNHPGQAEDPGANPQIDGNSHVISISIANWFRSSYPGASCRAGFFTFHNTYGLPDCQPYLNHHPGCQLHSYIHRDIHPIADAFDPGA